MCLNDLDKGLYYTITELPAVLKVCTQTVYSKVDNGEIVPDFTHPVTGRKYFEKKSIEEKYLKAGANQMV